FLEVRVADVLMAAYATRAFRRRLGSRLLEEVDILELGGHGEAARAMLFLSAHVKRNKRQSPHQNRRDNRQAIYKQTLARIKSPPLESNLALNHVHSWV